MNYIFTISVYSILMFQFSGILLFSLFHKKLSFEYKLIGVFILVSFIFQIFQFYGNNFNLYLYPLYGLFEFTLFSILFAKLIKFSKKLLFGIIVFLISILLIVEGVTAYADQNAQTFHSYGKIISNLSIITYSIYYIITALLDKSKKIDPQKINLSFVLLTYFAITLLNYISINFLVNNSLTIVSYFWQFHAVFNVLFYGALTFLLWKHGRSRKSLR